MVDPIRPKQPDFPGDKGPSNEISEELEHSIEKTKAVAQTATLHKFSAKQGGFSLDLPPVHNKVMEAIAPIFNSKG